MGTNNNIKKLNVTALKKFVDIHGYKNLLHDTVYDHANIGSFRTQTRIKYNKLTSNEAKADMIKEFSFVDRDFLRPRSHEEFKKESIEATLDFIKKFGFQKLKKTTVHNDIQIGAFRDFQVNKYRKLKSKVQRLTTIEEFSLVHERYLGDFQTNKMNVCIEFVRKYGYEKLKSRTIYNGISIGRYRVGERYKYIKLESEEEKKEMREQFNLIHKDFLIDTTSEKQLEFNINICVEFTKKHGYDKFRYSTIHNEVHIGNFRCLKRMEYKRLETDDEKLSMQKKFDLIHKDFLIDTYEERLKSKKFDACIKFVKKYGYEEFSKSTVFNGVKIGSFRFTERKKYRELESDKEKLAMIEMYKPIHEDFLINPVLANSKKRSFDACIDFLKTHCYEDIQRDVIFNGVNLGNFRANQKSRYNKLDSETKKAALRKEFKVISIHFFKNQRTKKNIENGINATLDFIKEHGYENLKSSTRYKDVNIGDFRKSQKLRYKNLKTIDEKLALMKQFNRLPKDFLTAKDAERIKIHNIKTCIEFVKKHGFEKLVSSTIFNEKRIGYFKSNQRQKYLKLKDNDEKRAMEKEFSAIHKDFLKAPKAIVKDNIHVISTLEFIKEFGYEELTTHTKHNGVGIGAFRSKKRYIYNNIASDKEKLVMRKEYNVINKEYLMNGRDLIDKRYMVLTLEFTKKFGYDKLESKTVYKKKRIGAYRNKQRNLFKKLNDNQAKVEMIKKFSPIRLGYLFKDLSTFEKKIAKAANEFLNEFGYEHLENTTRYKNLSIGNFHNKHIGLYHNSSFLAEKAFYKERNSSIHKDFMKKYEIDLQSISLK